MILHDVLHEVESYFRKNINSLSSMKFLMRTWLSLTVRSVNKALRKYHMSQKVRTNISHSKARKM